MVPDDRDFDVCLACGEARWKHVAGIYCLDACHEVATFVDQNDPGLLVNVLGE